MPTVRRTATLSVTEPVDGTPRRRGPDRRQRHPARSIKVDPRVMARVRQVQRQGEALRIISENCVVLEPRLG